MPITQIHNATLIDGRGGPPIANAALRIRDERVEAVGPANHVGPAPAGARTIDARGATLLPGLVDAHVHLMLEEADLLRMLATPFSLNFYLALDRMQRTLAAGVTSVRDAAGADLGLKRAVESGLVAGPRMQISTTALSITGGHLDFWMPSGNEIDLLPSHPGLPRGICDGVDGVRAKVREVLRAGADIVKICSTGGVMSPTDHPDFAQFSPEELAVVVSEAAARRGVKVMAHAQGAEGVKNAVRAGVHSIEHGVYLDDEAIDLMLERGTFLVPTLLAPLYVIESGEAGANLPPGALDKAREVFDAHQDSVARAHRAGVRIAMGTDAGVMPHGTNARELGLMVDVGMSPMEAIVASTASGAACLGWQGQIGTLEAGALADVVVVNGDPLEDVRVLERRDAIACVLKGGEVVAGELGEAARA